MMEVINTTYAVRLISIDVAVHRRILRSQQFNFAHDVGQF